MRCSRSLTVAAAALLLGALPLVLAHGDEDDSAGMSMDMDMGDKPAPAATDSDTLASYWSHPAHVGLIYTHILLMVIGWTFVLPIGVMFSIVKSRYTLLAQFVFLCVNGLGLLLGVIYDRSTPDLYPNNSHSKFGWAVTWIASAWTVMGLVNLYTGSNAEPVSAASLAKYQPVHTSSAETVPRWSNDSGQGTERNSSSLYGHSRTPSVESGEPQFPDRPHDSPYPHDEEDDFAQDEKRGFLQNSRVDRFLSEKITKLAPFRRTLKAIRILYSTIERFMIPLGFVGIATGTVVYGGIARGNDVFNVLAHYIKGAIFFGYGLLTLGRWMGAFADFGWAWNVKPPAEIVGRGKARVPTAEFTESFVIFLYGASNMWLEHLAAWGGEWTAQDLEHVSISIMFFGGGLLGMIVESRRLRDLLNNFMLAAQADRAHLTTEDAWTPPKQYTVSLNPLPGLVILLLGSMMGSHHQASMLSSMVHKQWGNMFVGFALARAVTYVLMYLAPPTSYLPTRPPSEIIASFCLAAGGITFMISNKDTVAALESYGLDAMFTLTVTIGLTALILAWATVVMCVKGWAARKEAARHGRGVASPVTPMGGALSA